MDCEKLRTLLDAYIDGELSEEDARALAEHARNCESCRRELEAAELLRDTLADLDDDIAVPLQAQAAWRNAVRTEANKRKLRKNLRMVYAAAAALVLVLGSTLMLRGNGTEGDLVPMPMNVQPIATENVIARDGMARSMDAAPVARTIAAEPEVYAARKKIETGDVQKAIGTIEDLAAEYSGSCSLQDGDTCRIELPAAYLEDFLSAASHVGTELDSEAVETQEEQAIVYIQICEAQ